MDKRGYLEGAEMATTFNMLRANDLIWSFVVNNYLLGKDPFPFDLLYWNSDIDAHAGGDAQLLSAQDVPGEPAGRSRAASRSAACRSTCARSTCRSTSSRRDEDHIAPWKIDLRGDPALSAADKRFVLAGSGHIAGVVNPPAAGKYGYWTNDELPAEPGRVARGRQAARRLLVDRLGALERGLRGRQGAGPRAWRRRAAGAGGRSRVLRPDARRLRAVSCRCSPRSALPAHPAAALPWQPPGRRDPGARHGSAWRRRVADRARRAPLRDGRPW